MPVKKAAAATDEFEQTVPIYRRRGRSAPWKTERIPPSVLIELRRLFLVGFMYGRRNGLSSKL